MNDFTFTREAFEQYLEWQQQDKNRLVYEMDELQNIKIIACKGHYED